MLPTDGKWVQTRFAALATVGLTVGLAVALTACSPSGSASIEELPTPESLALPDEPAPTTTVRPPLPPYGPGEGHNRLDWLADQAALVALDLAAADRQQIPTELALDLSGLPNLSDRVALGLAALDLSFTRSDTADETGHYGTVITVHDDPTTSLAQWPEMATFSVDGAAQVRRETRAALRHDVDVTLVPSVDDWSTSDSWFAASSADASLLATELVGAPGDVVAWSNREAQRYVAEAVEFGGAEAGGFAVSTESRASPPSVFELPYDSGMVIAHDRVGWATISASITLPQGDGLWPAIWLLGNTACDAPGRCLGYETDAYYEIDLLEARGQAPEEVHLSLHWFDERIRSATSVSSVDEPTLRLEFERRPGLLLWRLDGTTVGVHAGRVDSVTTGPHNADPMMLIVNTAVGGSFAGEQQIGRTGNWLGEALVPNSYPDSLSAEFVVHEIQVASR